jgi:chromosome segregation ATPase
MTDERTIDPPTSERWVSCEIPGCTQRMPYSGRGAPPKYCGQTVQGVRHTRLTAHRLVKGQITLPLPGNGQTTAEVVEQGEVEGEEARPVTAARMTLELLLAEVSALVSGHEKRLGVLAEQISHAVRTAADTDAVAAEVSAAHRAARAEIDRAEAERDQALGQAREARRNAEAADERATVAETAAEEALTEVETAQLARDQAIGERDELTAVAAVLRTELQTSRAQADQLRKQVTDLQREASELTSAQNKLNRQLQAERVASEQRRQRAESAEREAIRAAAQAEQLSIELSTARAQLEHWQTQAAEMRAELAGMRSNLGAAKAAAQIEKDHAAQRLADRQTHYEELINELRARLPQPTNPRARQNNP